MLKDVCKRCIYPMYSKKIRRNLVNMSRASDVVRINRKRTRSSDSAENPQDDYMHYPPTVRLNKNGWKRLNAEQEKRVESSTGHIEN